MEAQITVNGSRRTVTSDPTRPLLDVLREDLGLTGTKYGCGEGMCGACTVLMDGKPVRSCITPVSDAGGKSILTIEGLSRSGTLNRVQEAFLDIGAIQCGYCTPGMILGTVALLQRNPSPTDAEIVDALNGHLCRCCGYEEIIAAVRKAAGQPAEAQAL